MQEFVGSCFCRVAFSFFKLFLSDYKRIFFIFVVPLQSFNRFKLKINMRGCLFWGFNLSQFESLVRLTYLYLNIRIVFFH